MVFCPLMFGRILVVGVFGFKSSICLNQKLLFAALENHLSVKLWLKSIRVVLNSNSYFLSFDALYKVDLVKKRG